MNGADAGAGEHGDDEFRGHGHVDRHHVARGEGDKVALVWVGEPVGERRAFTYRQLLAEVCRFAGGLESLGVKPGD
ncbi:MAG: AMP-binding protein, partial [Planctomycetia bacterium]